MKYPFVIFYRNNKFSSIDNFFIENARLLDCTIFIANTIEHVKKLHNSNYHLLITYGEIDFNIISVISENMLVRHMHINVQNNIMMNIQHFNEFINLSVL